MSTMHEIKNLRDRLAKEVTEEKKQYDQMTTNFRALAEQIKATEENLAKKVKHLTGLDNLLHDAGVEAAPKGRKGKAAKEAKAAKPGKPGKAGKIAKASKAEKPAKAEKTPRAKKAKAESNASAVEEKPAKTPRAKKAEKPAKTPRAKKAKSATGDAESDAPKATRKGRGKGASPAAEGRRAVAEGLRPPIKEALAKILGGKTMSIDEIFDGLKAKSWLPNSSDPRQYISYLLSTSKTRFERVASAGRGFYRVKTDEAKVEKAKPEKTNGKADASTMSMDEVLANAGVFDDAPFGG